MKKYFKITLSFLLVLFLSQCGLNVDINHKESTSNEMKVHFIDVGQGDAILVQVNSKNLLIDSGPRDSKDKLATYLKSLNISQFDYILATHPHEDHIGNMSYVLDNFKVLNFYAPKVDHSTKTFEKMVESIVKKDLKIKVLKANVNSIDLGENTLVEVFSPISDKYEELNNYSPIIKVSYGNTSFLFTGDAEQLAEEEVLNTGATLKSDVLKIGHHGSTTSTSQKFFDTVNPSITVIPVGKDNTYGHPKPKILSRIKDTQVYRTDIDGNIVITSDGISLK